MEILAVTHENLEDCISVFIKAYNQTPWNYQWTFEKAKQYLSEYLNSASFVGFIMYDQQKAVGAIFGHTKTWWTNKQLMVDEFFISAEKQRRGYGKKLMEYCNQYARAQQVELLILMTNKYMPAYKFYNTIGYTTTEQYVFMFKQLP
jgi:GNAT superfamily N-acetyltransferase